jgi:hypothetical protein
MALTTDKLPPMQQASSRIKQVATKMTELAKNNKKTAIGASVVLAAGVIALAVKKAGVGQKCDHCG